MTTRMQMGRCIEGGAAIRRLCAVITACNETRLQADADKLSGYSTQPSDLDTGHICA